MPLGLGLCVAHQVLDSEGQLQLEVLKEQVLEALAGDAGYHGAAQSHDCRMRPVIEIQQYYRT